MALKICQLCAVDFTLKKFLLPLIDGMRQAGWEVTSVCSDGAFVPELRAQGYRVETLPIMRSLDPIAALRIIVALVRLFRIERYDVLHAHTPVAALLGRIAARLADVPLIIYTAHGFYFHDEMPFWKRRLYIALEWLGGRLTDFLFTQSVEDAASAVRHGIMPSERTLAIGNGVSVARFDPTMHDPQAARTLLGIPAHVPVIGIVGRLVREKGYVEFLRAAEAVGTRFPDAHFLVVGERLASDHDAHIDVDLTWAKQSLGNRLILTGMREDVPSMLAAMDVFCLPSYREGMPRTIIEAMMMGKPVVATNIRGAREEVVEGQTGLLVPTRDSNALAQSFGRLIENPALRARMGNAGRERALALYDEKHVVEIQVNKVLELVRLGSV